MTTALDAIAARVAAVRDEITASALRAGRDPSSVRLVAVSKTHPAECVRAAYAAGQRDFGENYVQELVAKREALADLADLRWHVIGNLQRNKARAVAGFAAMVHTVDDAALAAELDRRASAVGRALDVLVQVNVAGESQKSGCAPDALGAVLAAVRGCASLRVRGLMTVPPLGEPAEASRPVFARLRALRDAHGGAEALPELSMGMSHDLDAAVAEGATLVRVGTAIFGARG